MNGRNVGANGQSEHGRWLGFDEIWAVTFQPSAKARVTQAQVNEVQKHISGQDEIVEKTTKN